MSQPRIAIIGAGVIGLASAFALLRRGASVSMFDADKAGSGATTKAAGMLGLGHELARRPETPLFQLGIRSMEAWPAFAREVEQVSGLSIGFDTTGTLSLAFDDIEAAGVQRSAEACAGAGFPVELLDGEEALEREPALGREPLMAAWLPDGQIDPVSLVAALKLAVLVLGGVVNEGVAVASVEMDRGPSINGQAFDAVVLATGASALPVFAKDGAALDPGLREMTGVRGLMLALQPDVGAPRHVVRSGPLYIAPKARWTLVGGALPQGEGEGDGAAFDRLREAATGVLGGIGYASEAARWSGVRPSYTDGAPVIGLTAISGVFAALGHYRHGVLLAPATADLIVKSVIEGTCDDLARAFSASRFDKAPAPSQSP